jgi:uncharacterized protein (DUF58 family)
MTALLMIGIGIFKNINLVTLLGYVLVAVLVLNWFVAGRALPHLRVRRVPDEPIFAGQPTVVELEVANLRRRACWGIQLRDSGPAHEILWFVDRLPGRGVRLFAGEVTLPRRGRYAWGGVVAISGHPFGLARRQLPVAPPEEVIVLPHLGWLHRGLLRRYLRGPDPRAENVRRAALRHPAAQAEFHGLRSYRTGDSPRTIHWRTSARRGELMVREFEDVPGENLILIFDPTVKDDTPPERFEDAIGLAATICWEWCRTHGDRFIVATAGTPYSRCPGQVLDGVTGPEHAARVLECLAVQEPGQADSCALVNQLKAHPLPRAAIVVVSATPSALAFALYDQLRRPVTILHALALDEYEFYQKDSSFDG